METGLRLRRTAPAPSWDAKKPRARTQKQEPPVPSGWIGIGAADAVQVFLGALEEKIAKMDATAIRDLVAAGEGLSKKSTRLQKHRIRARIGEEIPLAISRIRPGQVQISWDHVRDKLLELLTAMRESPKDVIARFLAGERLAAFVDEKDGDVILVDGHHKLSAIFALRGLVGASMFGGTHVPVMLREERPLFLEDVDGKIAKSAPSEFAALENNPFRKLAAQTCLKIKMVDDEPTFSGSENPLWIKSPLAEEFIEFRLARIMRRALEKAGITWTPGTDLDAAGRAVVRRALLEDADEDTHALDESSYVLLVPEDWTRSQVESRLSIGRKRGKLRFDRDDDSD